MAIQPDVILNKKLAIMSLRRHNFYRQPDYYRFVNRVIPLLLAEELVQEHVASLVIEEDQTEYLKYKHMDNDKLIDDAVGLAQTFKEMAEEQAEEMFEGDADLIMNLVGKIRQLENLVLDQNETIEYLKGR